MSELIFAGDERLMIVKFGRLLTLCLQRLRQLEIQLAELQSQQADRRLQLDQAMQTLRERLQDRSLLLEQWGLSTEELPDSHLAQKRSAYIETVNAQVQLQRQVVDEARRALETIAESLRELRLKLQRQRSRRDQLESMITKLRRQQQRSQTRRAEGLVEERYCRRRTV